MDVREKLVELLAGCPCESDCEGMVGSCPHRKNGNCNEIFKLSYCAVSKLAQHLITNGVTVQEWISVKDRLPETNGYHVWVIACVDGERSCVRMFERRMVRGKVVERFKYPWETISDENITHWTYLPKPPKGE